MADNICYRVRLAGPRRTLHDYAILTAEAFYNIDLLVVKGFGK
jgi:hypothetical protein